MPADPIDVVCHVLKEASFDDALIAEIKDALTKNSPQRAEEMAQDHAIQAHRRADFNQRFPGAARIGSAYL